MRGSLKKRMLLVAVVMAACLVLVVGVANAVVLLGDDGELEHAQVALVLGAGLDPDGRPSTMLRDRVAVAADLYNDGRVDRVLASGDHGTVEYDEVNTMRESLRARGVPDSKIFTDHAGFDTWDSVVRAKKVFKVNSAIIVTQGFHLSRAMWLGKRAGLKVGGVSATRSGYGKMGKIGSAREVLARVKAVEQVVIGAEPRFLGEPVPIDGPASKSRG